MEMSKKKKITIISIVSAVFVVIIAALIVFSVNKTAIQFSLIYNVLPDSVEGTVGEDTPITFYKRKNPDYDRKTDDNPYNYIQFYFYDENGEEVVINGAEKFEYDGEEYGAPIGDFMIQASDEIGKIRTTMGVVKAVVIILLIAGLITVWFIVWSKKQDMEKEQKFKSKNNQKNKKSKRK